MILGLTPRRLLCQYLLWPGAFLLGYQQQQALVCAVQVVVFFTPGVNFDHFSEEKNFQAKD